MTFKQARHSRLGAKLLSGLFRFVDAFACRVGDVAAQLFT
jgi:hypothetical protein